MANDKETRTRVIAVKGAQEIAARAYGAVTVNGAGDITVGGARVHLKEIAAAVALASSEIHDIAENTATGLGMSKDKVFKIVYEDRDMLVARQELFTAAVGHVRNRVSEVVRGGR